MFLQTWREWHAALKAGSARLELAVARWHAATLSRAWQAWLEFVEQRQAQRELLATAVGCLLPARQSAAFRMWREHAQDRQVMPALQRPALEWLLPQPANSEALPVPPICRRALAAKLSYVVALLTKRALASAWHGWREAAHCLTANRATLVACVAKLQRQALWGAWAAWREFVEERNLKQEQLSHVVEQWRLATVCKAWRAWLEGVAEQQARVAKLLAAAKRWHTPLLSEALLCWLDQTRAQKQQAGQLQAAVAHWMNASLSTAFSTWRYQVRRDGRWARGRRQTPPPHASHLALAACPSPQVWKTKALRKAPAFLLTRTTAKAFQVLGVLRQQRMPTATDCICACSFPACLPLAPPAAQTWRGHSAHRKHLALVGEAVVLRWRNSCMSSAFSGTPEGLWAAPLLFLLLSVFCPCCYTLPSRTFPPCSLARRRPAPRPPAAGGDGRSHAPAAPQPVLGMGELA